MAGRGRLKTYFLRGLAVLLPTVVTVGVFVWGCTKIHEYISSHIARGLGLLIYQALGKEFVEQRLDPKLLSFTLNVAGFLLTLAVVFVVGVLLASVVGRTLWRMVEKFIMNTPFLRQVYPYAKQVTDFFLDQDKPDRMFSRVVGVEYPRKGVWSVGLVTGSGIRKVVENTQKEFLTVLIATSPTPFTGFVIMVPKEETVDLGITVEEALRFIITGGVITPPGRQPITLQKTQLGNNR